MSLFRLSICTGCPCCRGCAGCLCAGCLDYSGANQAVRGGGKLDEASADVEASSASCKGEHSIKEQFASLLSSDKQAYGYGAFDCPPCSGLLLWRNPSAEAQNITFTLRAALALPQVPFLDRNMSQYAWQSAKHDSHCFQAWPGGARLRLSGQKTLVSPFPGAVGGRWQIKAVLDSDVRHRRTSSDLQTVVGCSPPSGGGPGSG